LSTEITFYSIKSNMEGQEIDDANHIVPNGKVMFATDFILDLGNGTDYEFIRQSVKGKPEKIQISAKGERSLRLKLNKMFPRLRDAYSKPRFVTIAEYQHNLKKRDEAILEETKLHREVNSN